MRAARGKTVEQGVCDSVVLLTSLALAAASSESEPAVKGALVLLFLFAAFRFGRRLTRPTCGFVPSTGGSGGLRAAAERVSKGIDGRFKAVIRKIFRKIEERKINCNLDDQV
jgi:hypothetical protein